MKYTKKWFFGNNKKADDDYIVDYITAYIAENGTIIYVHYITDTQKWYEVKGEIFDTLKAAKAYAEIIDWL